MAEQREQENQDHFDERAEWGRFVAAWGYLTPSQQRQLAATAEGFKRENGTLRRRELPTR